MYESLSELSVSTNQLNLFEYASNQKVTLQQPKHK